MGGKKGSIRQASTLTPQQQQFQSEAINLLMNTLPGAVGRLEAPIEDRPVFQQGEQALGRLLGGFDPERLMESFEQNVAQPELQRFQREILPGIQERSPGRGSVLQQQLALAGSDLASRLSGQRAEFLRAGEESSENRALQALGSALGFAGAPAGQAQALLQSLSPMQQTAMQQAFQTYQQAPRPSPFGGLLGGLGMGLGAGLGGAATGIGSGKSSGGNVSSGGNMSIGDILNRDTATAMGRSGF